MMNITAKILCIGFVTVLLTQYASSKVPWQMVAEKYEQGQLLSEKSGNILTFSISKQLELSRLLKVTGTTSGEYSVEKWNGEQWTLLSTNPISLDNSDSAVIQVGNLDEGFYRIVVQAEDCQDQEGYFLVSHSWKMDLMGLWQTYKQSMAQSGNLDLGASILIAHLENLQRETASTSVLTDKILSRFSEAILNKKRYDHGEIPRLAKGLSELRFRRFKGADFAEFAVHVPEDYDSSNKWPLYVRIDPKRWSAGKYGDSNGRDCYHDGMIDLWWHSVPLETEQLYNNVQLKDFRHLLHALCLSLNIDADRLYLFGQCRNSISGMGIALNYPDTWAECRLSTGNSYRNLACNMFNVPFIFCNEHPDGYELTAYYTFASKCFQYHQCMDLTLVPQKDQWNAIGMASPEKVLNRSPKMVKYAIESMQNPKAYWLTIKGREDENCAAQIEASVEGQTLVVTRKNVDAYELDLKVAPLDHTMPMRLVDNGIIISLDPSEVYVFESDKYKQTDVVKNSRICGPIFDVFTDAYAVLFTEGKDKKQTEQIAGIARRIAGTGPVLSETNLTDQLERDCHLIVVGRPDKSRIFNKVSGQLPIRIENSQISFDGHSISGDWGVMMIYPNPVNREKYIVFVLADSDMALKNIWNVWAENVAKAKIDVAIVHFNSNSNSEFVRFEKFDSAWNWHRSWNEPLVMLSSEHPKWRWRQWIGQVIRDQMNADIMISEEVFVSDEMPNRSLTLRDLYRRLDNQWVVKIKVKGRELKTLLMHSFSGTSLGSSRKGNNKEAKDPIISGVTFVKGLAEEGGDIHVSQIEPDRYYTVVMPSKCVNGSRLGLILNDYEIVGDGYIVPLIKGYLEERKPLQLDDELEKMNLTIL